MFKFLQPRLTLSEDEIRSGLRALHLQGTTMMGLDAITAGGFMAAYALALGANNFQIGVLAALPFILQPLQIPAIALTERIRKRKQIGFFTIVVANLIWLPVALIPFLIDAPGTLAITLLLVFISLRSAVTPFFNVPWLSWMRDLVPEKQRGIFFARRLQYATALGMALGLGGAVFVDIWRENAADETAIARGFAIPLIAGTLTLGIAGFYFIARLPERRMPEIAPGERVSLVRSVMEPMRDPSYKHLIRFKFLSTLAMHLAIPFFAVYMLEVIELPVTAVMALTAVSQLANILFLGAWGRMVDRFGAKPILSASVSLYLLVILGWTFTTLPDRYYMTIPLLIILHAMAGIATAGMNVTHGTIAMKLSPEGRSTAYLAASSLSISLGAALGPLIGGVFADFFETRSFKVAFEYISGSSEHIFTPFFLTGFDFLFAISFLFGLMTLGALALVREEGEADRETVMAELMGPMRGIARSMSSVPGAAALVNIPLETARHSAVPGLDVAVGVTAYQVGEAARAAGRAAGTARRTALRIRRDTETIARQMVLGSVRTGGHLEEESRRAMHGAFMTLVKPLGRTKRGALDAVYGAGYGALETADITGQDPAAVAEEAIEAAREAAVEMPGVTPEEAVAEVSSGLIDAATQSGLSAEDAERVRRVAAEAIAESQNGKD